MPSQPIPIGSNSADVPSIAVSGSPQTPFAGSAVGLSTSTPGSLFGKWNAFGSLKQSTPITTNGGATNSPPGKGFTNQPAAVPPQHFEDDHFDHDSLEFGDLSDLKSRGWAAAAAARGQRRAVSMSVSPGTTLVGNQANISPPQMGMLNDKMSRGEGALRRLSLSTGGFGRPSMSQATPAVPNSTPMGSISQPSTAHKEAPAHPPIGGGGRRRFSESTGRKRGVSPMGERILRDQVHF